MNLHTIKYMLFGVSMLYNCVVFSQNDVALFYKIKQSYSKKQFYNSVFKNPALMPYWGKYRFSTVKATYKNSKDEAFIIQKPTKENSVSVSTSSFYPLDSTQTLWGNASYKNSNQNDIRWNESIDHDLLYPYFTADSIGGNLKNEKYSFLGGYAKSYKKSDFGGVFSYNATLASRDRDPRVEDIGSDLNIKIGVNFRNSTNRSIGFYTGFQKYTQENNLTFFSEISRPPIYHFNGLGYYNNQLKGTYLKAFYDAIGYNFGVQLKPTKKDDFWVTADFNQLRIDKFLVETLSTQIASLQNQSIAVDAVKLFPSQKNTYGVKLSYKKAEKTGAESVISARSGIGLAIIAQNENYNLRDNIFELSGLFYRNNNQYLLNVSPYANYQKYQEDYVLIRSYQYFDNLNVGLKSNYVKNISNRTIFSGAINANYKLVLDNKSLFRNDSEVSLSNMLRHNNAILGANTFSVSTRLKINYQLNPKLNFFFEVQGDLASISNQANHLFSISTGINF